MKKFFAFLAVFGLQSSVFGPVFAAKSDGGAHSAGNYTIGIGPIGNVYVTDRRPEMSPGVGALVYFDYRWSPELSTTASVMMLVQDGTDADRGENNIVFMGLPTFDLKYYFITNPSRWDPYAAVGIGYYILTAGSRGRGVASGLGAQAGVGLDYYLSRKLSIGTAAYFRSAALLGGGSTGNFPLSFLGNVGFHF
ncbi:MAG: OmpW family outer membrane protein [Deltaproteobacteria bacterium]|nr:OmpW family outer membrane protein [Deltaproteobacteria bacterium]MDZ4224550.1 OmpW family outer membrane protein [bacterium]